MGPIIYNLIVRPTSGLSGPAYLRQIQELVRTHGIQGPFILAGEKVTIANPKNLESEIRDGRPYANVPQIVKDYEDGLPRLDEPRWVVVIKSKAKKLRARLNEATIFKGNEVYIIDVIEAYPPNPLVVTTPKDQIREDDGPSSDPVEKPAPQQSSAEPEDPNKPLTLAELIKKVQK